MLRVTRDGWRSRLTDDRGEVDATVSCVMVGVFTIGCLAAVVCTSGFWRDPALLAATGGAALVGGVLLGTVAAFVGRRPAEDASAADVSDVEEVRTRLVGELENARVQGLSPAVADNLAGWGRGRERDRTELDSVSNWLRSGPVAERECDAAAIADGDEMVLAAVIFDWCDAR